MQKNQRAFYLTARAVLVVVALGLATVASSGGLEQTAAPHAWKTYTNVRFQYAICYPEDLLVPQGESDNSDGQKFLANDSGQLVVFGSNNGLNQPLKNNLAATASRLAGTSGKVTYKLLKPDWFVISGQNGPIIFYAKVFFSRGQFKSFELTYNGSAASVYEPLIRRLAVCFADLVH
ncbi:MAG TPA: hypothetical protein VKC66_21205 [Xanthobacteraceae bacterium]|nr:hypothetical protein [Xanthobacteraceae bacterium]